MLKRTLFPSGPLPIKKAATAGRRYARGKGGCITKATEAAKAGHTDKEPEAAPRDSLSHGKSVSGKSGKAKEKERKEKSLRLFGAASRRRSPR